MIPLIIPHVPKPIANSKYSCFVFIHAMNMIITKANSIAVRIVINAVFEVVMVTPNPILRTIPFV